MFILRRLNWKKKEIKEEEEVYDLHKDIWVRCMEQIRTERTERTERLRNEKLKKELSINSSKSNTRIIHNSGRKKIAEGGLLSHQTSPATLSPSELVVKRLKSPYQDSVNIRKPESINLK